jgi:hypothetical protein
VQWYCPVSVFRRNVFKNVLRPVLPQCDRMTPFPNCMLHNLRSRCWTTPCFSSGTAVQSVVQQKTWSCGLPAFLESTLLRDRQTDMDGILK